jgi:hypothetical protein
LYEGVSFRWSSERSVVELLFEFGMAAWPPQPDRLAMQTELRMMTSDLAQLLAEDSGAATLAKMRAAPIARVVKTL